MPNCFVCGKPLARGGNAQEGIFWYEHESIPMGPLIQIPVDEWSETDRNKRIALLAVLQRFHRELKMAGERVVSSEPGVLIVPDPSIHVMLEPGTDLDALIGPDPNAPRSTRTRSVPRPAE